jgi:pyruvate dehydrogenase E2 component (dihydrolipoamide acetyltransferase)
MDLDFKMPDLATTDSEIKVIRWLVEPGQPVKRGQALLEVETDKAMMEVESIATGVLKAARVKAGDAVISGQLIAVLETTDASSPTASAPLATAASSAKPTAPKIPASASGGMFARNRAAKSSPTSPGLSLTATQRTVGRRMQESKQQAPHFYLQATLNAEPMVKRRAAATEEGLAWDAFFAQAAAKALQKFGRMGARFVGDGLRESETRDIGVAVDHENELYVVSLAEPASKSVEEISRDLRAAVKRLRAGDAEARRLRPTVMTITNLGASRVDAFTAIVNPPEAAILAIGRAAPAAAVVGGTVVVQHQITVTLSVDHRVVNGRYAADFLTEIVNLLEAL